MYSCLLALVMGCHVTAEITHEVVEEKQSVALPCPQPVGDKVTWSRKSNGRKVDLITADGNKDTRHNDPNKRYSSVADQSKSLLIIRAAVSDSGTYVCNNQTVKLTVIPSGTIRVNVAERSSVTLDCSDVGGSKVPSWSRETAGERQQLTLPVSAEDKSLTLRDVRLRDSGLYDCDGKPAAYVTVTKAETSSPPKPNTSSTQKLQII
ncbi:hypothetical protein Q5P01_018837 [Channa striata]|uniref:Ig-like domain-containing protein n=1 Tax=Channa striata TaxID=64152 RepID=A0AA88M5X2_CHASR|nr:hypothetical protein Q5P01_018837 [Channa striata]